MVRFVRSNHHIIIKLRYQYLSFIDYFIFNQRYYQVYIYIWLENTSRYIIVYAAGVSFFDLVERKLSNLSTEHLDKNNATYYKTLVKVTLCLLINYSIKNNYGKKISKTRAHMLAAKLMHYCHYHYQNNLYKYSTNIIKGKAARRELIKFVT